MIVLAYILNDRRLDPSTWGRLCTPLPPSHRARIARYHRWEDRQATLYGILLLRVISATVLGAPINLERISHDEFARPSVPELPDFDYNISHTDGLVVCCAAEGIGRVGVDVEKRLPVCFEDFRRVFTEREYGYITESKDSLDRFYHLWTRKEAVMKADGRGFHLDPRKIDVLEDRVSIDGHPREVRAMALSSHHACHLAADRIDGVDIMEYCLIDGRLTGHLT